MPLTKAHSITFHRIWTGVEKNTWDDWNLVPVNPPFVEPPKIVEKMIEVPGRNGLLDLSAVLTSDPSYGNRTGKWEFYILFDRWKRRVGGVDRHSEFPQKMYIYNSPWISSSNLSGTEEAYKTITQFLGGRRFNVYLYDQDVIGEDGVPYKDWYYTGRVWVESLTTGKEPKITIGYNLEPFRTNQAGETAF